MRPRPYSYILFILVLVILAGWAPHGHAKDIFRNLPRGEALCVNRAAALIQARKFSEAAAVIKAFQDRQQGVTRALAAQKGYTHYTLDFYLGNCLMMMDASVAGRLEEAARAYDQAVAKAPDFSEAWLNLAQCRYGLNQMAKAGHAFVRGYDTAREKKAKSLYYGAACFYHANAHQEALDTFYRLIKRHKSEIRLEWTEILVNTLFALDRNPEALPWIQTLAADSREDKQKNWQEVLLYQYLTLGMDKAALDYARNLTGQDPGEPKWWKALAHIHLGKDRLAQGLQSLMIYGFLTPLSPSEIRLTADLYSACNIPLEAARYYEDWLRAGPEKEIQGKPSPEKKEQHQDRSAVILKMANAFFQGGDPRSALDWADKGLALKKDPGLLEFKARLLFHHQEYQAAGDVYEQLARFKDFKGRAFLMMGYAAWNTGQFETAARAFERAALYPDQKKAARASLVQVRKMIAQNQIKGLASTPVGKKSPPTLDKQF
ncbi:MAG: tetratricopeptide repeat protein [Desulfobacter sp.]|nr:tetratricopeptide repeat protein [Desulfobacter sp.]